MSPTRHTLSPTRTSARQRPCSPSPTAPLPPPQQADWTLLEVWSWPAAAQAAPPQGTPPGAPPGPALSWPLKRRWPDLDDLGPVEWLQVPAPAQASHAAQPIKPAR